MIPFNKPSVLGSEEAAVKEVFFNGKLSGNGPFTKKSTGWLEENLPCGRALLTPSCTAALEMSAILTNVGPGDEVIMPSYTFVSTANAFVLRGAMIRFVDVDPETMNISPVDIEAAVTGQTKAIVVVHYAGVACDMDVIMDIANRHNLWVIEDAAQALMSTYKGKALGTIGHLGTFSFHETKNITCGEGGALIINDPALIERAEIIQEKGTNRKQFVKGMVDKYTWRDIGSSYIPSELNAAYLFEQLQHADLITCDRLKTWQMYYEGLLTLDKTGRAELPHLPEGCMHNAHMFYLKTPERDALMSYLQTHEIMAVTHYVPLHTSVAGKQFGTFVGEDIFTTQESEKLLRLPLYFGMKKEAVDHVIERVCTFFEV
ncbi:dTDP-4-amino-4,6-dideoxygalactose transaminase [Lentibacillus sp. JNUCC-1]|uniref:dTDP-4-amino-4,6-dideoxygalactose transaminase n=1 Tax=Lentibacillus sp. JNUCC-1 TaxID=2654513 RepID=UPI0012E96107|nr:dTDP-4-amino-4,6-dideoxygalactose transaminase [Lentibacillus sp. JNUCC-1]MUV36478.1 dTDP-4-amino-4,6-dideoxygalactose transaminase [Lentibacillus sp. JNUCC-1]